MEKTWVVAQMWCCGDDVCDCSQPQIELVGPGENYPWLHRAIIWQGIFQSESSGMSMVEYEEQRKELQDEAAKHGIELDEDLFGKREATNEEVAQLIKEWEQEQEKYREKRKRREA